MDHLELITGWRFRSDPFARGEAEGWQAERIDDAAWPCIAVPCAFDAVAPEFAGYQGRAWFRCRVRVPAAWAGQRLVLAGEGLFDRADVWCDGRPLGAVEDPFLPWALPLPAGAAGRDIAVAIRVDNTPRHDRAPGQHVGWRPLGGLLRPVRIEAQAWQELRLDHLDTGPDGALALRLSVLDHGRDGLSGMTLRCSVRDPSGAVLQTQEMPATGTVAWSGTIAGTRPWSPESPVMHRLTVELLADGVVRATRSWPFGFRRIAVTGGRVTVNGAAVLLTGFNLHEDRPDGEFRWHPDLAQDLARMRAAGSTMVRLCHYPHDPRTLDACDEAGLLVLAEAPLYWTVPAAEGAAAHDARLAHARRQLIALIDRDRHHPSICLWSVSNETDEGRPEVLAANQELVRLAQRHDPTRPATHVSNSWVHTDPGEADDVISLNGYPTLEVRAGTQRDAAAWWRSGIDRLARRHPGKPILISEFGHPGWPGEGQEQAEALRNEALAFDHPAVCGALVWCWADHLWRLGHPWMNNLAISPYGVVSRERHAKPGLAAISAVFQRMRGVQPAAPRPQPPPAPGADIPVAMERLHMRDLPVAVFPEGFGIRPQQPGDDVLWCDIWRDTEPVLNIDDGLFRREYGHDPAAIPRRCFILTGPRGVGVGTIAAWQGRDGDASWGRIHWVAVRPAFQGRGLARAALAHAMQVLAGWHDHAWLATSSTRLGAIALYRSFGFTPCIRNPADAAVWAGIDERTAALRAKGVRS